jgi:Tol biopolymer transport system component
MQSGTQDLMTMDTGSGALLPFASGTSGRVSTPIWTPDGSMMRFTRTPATGSPAMFEKSLDGGSERPFRTPLRETSRFFPTQIMADGLIVAFVIRDGNRDVVTISADSEPKPFAQTTANETQGALSPSGRWMAYVSDAEGGEEAVVVWVEAFPEGGKKLRASGAFRGAQPRWRDDGKELYFLAKNGDLMTVAVTEARDTLTLGAPQKLFRTWMNTSSGLGTKANYDVTRDGSRVIVAEAPDGVDGRVVTVLVNWMGTGPARQ